MKIKGLTYEQIYEKIEELQRELEKLQQEEKEIQDRIHAIKSRIYLFKKNLETEIEGKTIRIDENHRVEIKSSNATVYFSLDGMVQLFKWLKELGYFRFLGY